MQSCIACDSICLVSICGCRDATNSTQRTHITVKRSTLWPKKLNFYIYFILFDEQQQTSSTAMTTMKNNSHSIEFQFVFLFAAEFKCTYRKWNLQKCILDFGRLRDGSPHKENFISLGFMEFTQIIFIRDKITSKNALSRSGSTVAFFFR